MRTLRAMLLLTVPLALVLPVAAYAQSQEMDFVVTPSAGSDTAPRGGYFQLSAEPGAVIMQSLDVRNDSAQPLELRLSAADALTGPLGGVSYGLPDDEAIFTGAWIDLDRTTLTLDAGASTVVPFAVNVPADAGSGQHLAGISVGAVPATTAPGADPTGGAGVSVDVQTRRVVAVQVDLPGPATPELMIHGVTVAARPDGPYLEIELENTGTALTQGEGTITAAEDDFAHDFTIGTFVPATSIAYPIPWTPDSREGEHAVQVEVRYGDDVARWEGTVVFGDDLRDELAEREVTTGDDGGFEIPPLLIAAVALLVLVLAILGVRRLQKQAYERGVQSRD